MWKRMNNHSGAIRSALLFFIAAALSSLAVAQKPSRSYAHVSIDEVQKFLGKPSVFIFDVNVPEIWAAHHLPGAIHVTSPNLKKFLPANKTAILIFYCAEPRCSAAEAAATEAARLRYTRVYVMPEGIFGWINAGKPIEKGNRRQ